MLGNAFLKRGGVAFRTGIRSNRSFMSTRAFFHQGQNINGKRIGAAAAVAATMAVITGLAKNEDNTAASRASFVGVRQYAANDPIEDRIYYQKMENGAWWFTVLDGHGGWQCSDYAHQRLHQNLRIELANRCGVELSDFSSANGESLDPHLVVQSLRAAFERTDRQYMAKVTGAFELGFGRETRAGSCALAAMVIDDVLYIANCGDSRAVLGVDTSRHDAAKSHVEKLKKKEGNVGTIDVEDPDDIDPQHTRRMGADALNMDESLRQAALELSIGKDVDPATRAALRDSMLNSMHRTRRASKVDALVDSSVISLVKPKKTDGPREFSAIEMSNDHNCREKRERERLEHEHPGEVDVVICRKHNPNACYIKGKLQPSRALGDFYLKYSEFVRGSGDHPSMGKRPALPFSPPYIRATPEIQVRKLTKGLDEFLILATDGLWDYISSQEAVDIVSESLQKPNGSMASAAEALELSALTCAAKKKGMSLEQLRKLKPGRTRRSKHDDISVIVVSLPQLMMNS